VEVRSGTNSLKDSNLRAWTPEMAELYDVDLIEGRHITDADLNSASPSCVIGMDIVDNLLWPVAILWARIATGREFNETDTEHHAPVVLLGFDTTNLLFPDGSRGAVGQDVTIDGQLFTVIGTLQKRRQGISGGSNPEDNIALMPVTTLRKLYPNKRDYVIFAKAHDPKYVTEAVEEIRELLRRKRRLSNGKPDDFALFTSDYFLDLWNKISGLIFLLTFAGASVGLLVGGIGVMNIMLVSVTERTREIGVRKAIGAKRSNILMQFLIEAVTLSALGGIIGVVPGCGADPASKICCAHAC
jgi:putative ABC transport system permease protein